MRSAGLVLFVQALLVSGHICLLKPAQRGPLSVQQPGDPSCYRRTGYCGGIPSAAPTEELIAGRNNVVKFQQNLNHWMESNPGYLDVAISYEMDPKESDFTVLHSMPDYPAHDMVMQMDFSVTVAVPAQTSEHAILRVRYVSHNTDEIDPKNNTESVFYNCADVRVVAARDDDVAVPFSSSSLLRNTAREDVNCCTPSQWEGTGHGHTPLGPMEHKIYFDSERAFVRWEQRGVLEPGGAVTTLILITNYTATKGNFFEYLIYPETSKCLLYGGDAMYDWCYGSKHGSPFSSKTGDTLTFHNDKNQFVWSALGNNSAGCLPLSFQTPSGVEIALTSHKVGPADPSLFVPPSYCKTPTIMPCANRASLEQAWREYNA